jgi:hypothetical protein
MYSKKKKRGEKFYPALEEAHKQQYDRTQQRNHLLSPPTANRP